MNHFLEISQLSREQIITLVQRALDFKRNPLSVSYPQYTVVNLFYENSTRTRVSFELAARNLSMPVINMNLKHSSESKGEELEDTIRTLAAMGIKIFIIRHEQEGLPKKISQLLSNQVHIVNAGDGKHAHPSQAMLDIMTIIEQKPDLSQLKITIVGDICHSRVANSLQDLCEIIGIKELVLVAPKPWQPTGSHYGRVTTSLQDGLADADVVIGLRVQRERMQTHEICDVAQYRRDYALTNETMAYAKKDVMIMHPGPINRGMEIDSDVADGSRSFILKQVENGVFMRMAILEHVLRS